MRIKKVNNQKAFTLIELLVSIALFSVVITISLGAIITIADSNKKARSMMQVMNNLNFAVDSMTRSFKSGEISPLTGQNGGVTSNNRCFSTNEADYTTTSESATRFVQYCVTNQGQLTKQIQDQTAVPLTSPDVVIDYAKFTLYGNDINQQPLLSIVLEGEVKITEDIVSRFTIHTSVAQRMLNI